MLISAAYVRVVMQLHYLSLALLKSLVSAYLFNFYDNHNKSQHYPISSSIIELAFQDYKLDFCD